MEKNLYYAGCNHWENNGANENEPVGTATAMHDCGDCEQLDYCKVKQKTEVFPFTAQDNAKFKEDWKATQTIAKARGHSIL